MRMYKVGVSVPKPIAVYENILVMEFIGKNGRPAPLLKEVDLDLDTFTQLFHAVMDDVRKSVLRARLVHGDLSEYNIMIWKGRHYIIDVSQAVTLDHPNALDYLYRDVSNIVRFFSRQGVETPRPEDVFREIVSNLR
jgi:RIO kinase 1